jgi:D-alanine--poly(phosphoribitol) ligase subunit 1
MNDVVESILHRCTDTPGRPAIIGAEGTTSYGEFASLVRRFANSIHAFGAIPRVAILLPQDSAAYAAMVASLVSGGYYCPINIGLPYQRKLEIVRQFGPSVVVCSKNDALYGFKDLKTNFLTVEDLTHIESRAVTSPSDIGYVIFTSGSTGTPKGVRILREALNQFIRWSLEATEVNPSDRWGQFSNIGFDLSVMDIYTSLSAGASLTPISSPIERLYPARTIRERGLTIWHSVPSVVDLISSARQLDESHMKSLRLISFCGEPLYPHLLSRVFGAHPDVKVFNTYGPTETTVFCTVQPLESDTYDGFCRTTISIGEPIPGWELTLGPRADTDPNAGEIIISGDYIGDGYWGDKELTKSKFRHIIRNGRNTRSFATGDWAERIDGKLYFKHRIDRQVKIHGNRVELGEIDYALQEIGVDSARTVYTDGVLTSFVITRGEALDARSLRSQLRDKIPHYALPSSIVGVSSFPQSPNGKVDEGALILSLRNGKRNGPF